MELVQGGRTVEFPRKRVETWSLRVPASNVRSTAQGQKVLENYDTREG